MLFFHRSNASKCTIALFLALIFPPIQALRFYLHDRERRCFKFEAPFSTRVIGERTVANGHGNADLHIEVKAEATGRVVYESSTKDHTDTKFAFTTPAHYSDHAVDIDDEYDYEEYDMGATYSVCLLLTFDAAAHLDQGKRAVSFWIRPDHGVVQRGQEPKAEEGTVSRMNNALMSMQDSLKGMVVDLTTLQRRERGLVKHSESMSAKLIMFSVVSLVVICVTSALQFMHFKTYFKSKKLI